MNLRTFKTEDATFMLEWMHDDFVVHDMKTDFASKTLEDCYSFIKATLSASDNLHLAIVDENDIYMGTVSLKHITGTTAEFGITVRRCAMGKGFAKFGMQGVIEKGFNQIGLNRIYWCVAPENTRAVKFYDKNGFSRCLAPSVAQLNYTAEEIAHYIWYEVIKE